MAAPEYVKRKYDLHRLKDIENIVAEAVHSESLRNCAEVAILIM